MAKHSREGRIADALAKDNFSFVVRHFWFSLHLRDGLNAAHGVERSHTVKALPIIIKGHRARGYSFITIPELIRIASGKAQS